MNRHSALIRPAVASAALTLVALATVLSAACARELPPSVHGQPADKVATPRRGETSVPTIGAPPGVKPLSYSLTSRS